MTNNLQAGLTFRDLIQAQLDGKTVQYWTYSDGGKWVDYMATMQIRLESLGNVVDSKTYQIKITKPSIDWSSVSDDYKYLARNEGGFARLFKNRPTLGKAVWQGSGEGGTDATSHKSYNPGTCQWSESLVERPEYI